MQQKRAMVRSVHNCRMILFHKGDKYPIYHLSELQLNNDRDCIVVGSIVKRQALRLSVLRQLADDIGVLPQPITLGRLASETDYLEIEDEKQIVRICSEDGSNDIMTQLATGMCVCVDQNICFYRRCRRSRWTTIDNRRIRRIRYRLSRNAFFDSTSGTDR